MTQSKKENHSAYKFTIDILIEGPSNAAAMEKLLHLLNRNPDVLDMKVKAGEEIGSLLEIIDIMQKQQRTTTPFGSNITEQKLLKRPSQSTPPTELSRKGERKEQPSESAKPQMSQQSPSSVIDQINQHIKQQRLIRLHINKGHGVKLNIPCRILNFDPASQLMNVYHVDEKQVYAYYVNEIEEMIV